jgi:beta-galactosidase
MRPQVAVITDERLQNRDASFGALTGAVTGNRYALGRSGAPYDLFLRGDADSARAGYKAVWLLGLMDLTAHEQRLIRTWVSKGVTVLHTDGSNTTRYTPRSKKTTPYAGKVKWTAAELGALWEQAGVHRYLQTDDVLYAGRGWIGVHSLRGGEKLIRLPASATVTDPETGREVAREVRAFNTTLAPGETRLFRVDFIR